MNNLYRLADFREFPYWLIVMLAGIGLLWLLPEPGAAQTLLHYEPLHTSMEMVAVAIAAMIFGVAWATQKYQPDGRTLALGLGFLGVAALDWSHALSSAGLPDFITPNSSEKSINFWLMARLAAGITFLLVAFWPARLAHRLGYVSRAWALALVITAIGVVHFILFYFQAAMPRTFVEGTGLTNFKINFEYLLIVMYVTAGVGFLAFAKDPQRPSSVMLALASFTMALSEFFFTRYAITADAYNVAGHVYKIIAYGFLYRGVFLATVRHPYESLKTSEAHYAATLNTLPDLLFEVDREGVYRSVHANQIDQLAVSLETVVGKRLEQMLTPEACRVCYQAINEADQTGNSHGYRIELTVPKGVRHFELSVAKKTNQKNQSDTFLVLSRDITVTVDNEKKIRFEAKLNASLLALQGRAEHEQPAEFLSHAVTLVQELMDSPTAFIYEAQKDQRALALLVCSEGSIVNSDDPTPDTALPLSDLGRWADALRERRCVVINEDIYADSAKGLLCGPLTLHRLVSVPVLEGNQVKLIVAVMNKTTAYVDQDVTALQLFASTFWSMLKQRRKSAVINQLSKALEQSPHSIVITDTKAQIQYVNQAFCDVSGYSAHEVLGKNPKILQSGQTPSKIYDELWARLVRGESWRGEFVNRSKSGNNYVEMVSVYPIMDPFGELTHYVAHKVDVTKQKATEKRLQDLSDFDSLTGLMNKKSFYQSLNKAIEQAQVRSELLSLLWFNLDNFKIINESFGHDIGDEFLVSMANRLLESIGDRFTMARHAGDTFVAIIPRERQSTVAVLALEILNKLKLPVHLASQTVSVGASMGIAVFPGDAKTATTLASAAEIAMYRAKEEGRNGLRFFAADMQRNTQRSLDLAVSLNGAQDRGELYVAYQPQFDTVRGQIIGVEALLRWNHPKWGAVAPGEFIPLAEQTGLIVPIGFWVLEQVARQIFHWRTQGSTSMVVAVNVSAIQFARPGFVAELVKVLSEASVPTSCIEIEITEAVALKNAEQAVAIIQQLHDAGFQIALDDFGTGYSSLSYLRRYPINKLKIDQSFISELASNESDRSIVTAIIKMAHGLQMKTIAEGVETAEQAKLLKALGCDELQGYWMSRPIPALELESFIQKQSDKSSVTAKIIAM